MALIAVPLGPLAEKARRRTPEDIERERKILEALSGGDPAFNNAGWLGAIGKGLEGAYQGYQDRKLDAASTQNETDAARLRGGVSDVARSLLGGGMATGGYPAAPMPASGATAARPTMGDVATNRVAAAHSASALPGSFLSALDMHEGAGDYDTLFGHAQKNGPFAGTSVSSMPISDVLAFASPSGAYGQHVKGQVGRVATPMGRHQIVGTTLRNAVGELGIDPSTPFDAGTQDTIAAHLAQRRIASANSLPGKISALRSEWEGFKNVPDAQMAQIVADLEAMPMGGGAVGANESMASGQMAGGAEPMAMQPAPPLNAPQTVQDMPVAQQPVNVAQALFPMEEMAGMNPQRLPAQTGVDPRIIEALSSPYVDDGTRRIAEALFSQQMTQQQAEQERMRAEQEAQLQMQQRMQAAQAAGVDPRFIGDDEIWKAATGAQFREQPTDVQYFEYGNQNPGFFDYQQSQRRAGATNVNVNTGDTNDFFSGLSNAEGSSYQQILSTAPTAARTLGQLDQLEGLLANVDTGAMAQWKQIAGNYGVNTEGLDDIQAASALINQMVPSQRPPGSGPMSDADLELFKQSVPRIINQPGGNEKIIQTMRAINRYDMELARIVQDGLATAETTDNPQERAAIRADMRRRIGEMQNPLANFNDRMGTSSGKGNRTSSGIEWSIEE